MKKFKQFINENIKDLLKGKTEEEINKNIINLSSYEKLKLAKKYEFKLSDVDEKDAIKSALIYNPEELILDLKYDYDDLSKIVSDEEIKKGLKSITKRLFNIMKGNNRENAFEELEKVVFYLFKNGYLYDNTDTLGNLWFKHKTYDKYKGGSTTWNGYNTLSDAIDYVTRMQKLNNS